MKILLIGARGRLGNAFVRLLPAHTFLTPERIDVDITRRETIEHYLDHHAVDMLINTSAYNDVRGAEQDATLANLVNGTGPGILADVTAKRRIPFLHFSTDYVFDGTASHGNTEDDVPNPRTAYGMSKLLGERAVLLANPAATIVRVSRLFGPPGTDAGSKKSFVDIVLDLAKTQNNLTMDTTEVSCPTYVDDVVRHIKTHLFPLLKPGIFHMANQGGCTWYDWAKEILALEHISLPITPRETPMDPTIQKPPFSILLSTKLPPMRPWQEALREYLATKHAE